MSDDYLVDSAAAEASDAQVKRSVPFMLQAASHADEEYVFTVDIDGWEGPLDLLLAMARTQKVDLKQISILELVEQYLAFINDVRAMKLEMAADYLVMAAWLAYLKSALLLPRDPEIEPSPEEMAALLQIRLQRLAAMRECASRLMARDRQGRDVFARGAPEGLRVIQNNAWQCDFYTLLKAYGAVQFRNQPVVHMVKVRRVVTLDDAMFRLSSMLGGVVGWAELADFLPPELPRDMRKSALASNFAASLELARQGEVEIRQDGQFAPIEIRGTA